MEEKIYPMLREFVAHGESNSLYASKFKGTYGGLKIKASFGMGAVARVPWMAFLGGTTQINSGIYPIYLFFKSKKLLILAIGIGETFSSWREPEKVKLIKECFPNLTIHDFFKEKDLGEPVRYGSSLFQAAYPSDNLVEELVEKDLKELVEKYNLEISTRLKGMGRHFIS